MKKKSLALLTIALALTSISFAQGFNAGIKAGTNIFKVEGKTLKEEFRFGYHLGVFADLYFSEKWGISPEVMWSQTNFRTGNQFSDVYEGGFDDFKGKLNYLNIPILLNFRPSKFITFQAGPQFGILIDQHESLFNNGREAFKSGDFSMLGGAQLNIGSFRVGGRYQIGLNNINDLDDQDEWKNQGWQLYLGMKIL